jgi:hypothetical protein
MFIFLRYNQIPAFMILKPPSSLKLASLSFLIIFFTSCGTDKKEEPKDDLKVQGMTTEEMIQRGKYMVTAGGCHDCHSPKKLTPQGPIIDSSRMLSGHPQDMPLMPFDPAALKPGQWIQMAPDLTTYVGPWGVSYAANLTPDSTTGTGAWTKDVFIRTLRTGRHLGLEGGRPILPPMPWQEIGHMSDDDLAAIYTYLHSLPPVKNRVPVPLSPAEAATKAKK